MGNVIEVACCRGNSGATKLQRQQGMAATGKFNIKVPMPEHVWCQQMSGGAYPGNKFLTFTPSGVATLIAAKGCKDIYMNFKVDIDMDCGGQEKSGWSYRAIYDVVQRYKPEFAKHGVRITFCLTSFLDWTDPADGGSSFKDVNLRYWLEFADLHKLPSRAAESTNAFNPNVDYTKAMDHIGG